MTGRTHDTAALTLLAGALVVQPLSSVTLATLIAAFLANQIGGIAPDIDQPTAPFWRNLPIGGLFGRTVAKLLGGHRFLTHSILGVALLGYLAHWLLKFVPLVSPNINIEVVWWAFMIGVVSHLILDTFTKEGVPWLLPLPIKFGIPPLRFARITTGSWVENFIVEPILVLILIIICWAFYPEIATYVQSFIRS